MRQPRVVVLGMMGWNPFAGVAWQVLHYVEGFRRAGADVFYIEDTGSWPYDPSRNAVTDDPSYAVRFIDELMSWLGMADRWAYVAPDRTAYGLSRSELDDVLATADALVNVTGATVLRDEHLGVPVRMYLETDPVKPQIEVALGNQFTVDFLASHTHHFTFGENLGAPDSPVPVEHFRYFPTRQAVVLDWWTPTAPASPTTNGRYTTVASWRQTGKDITWNGETYLWSKHVEFSKFIALPRRTGVPLELSLACDDDAALAEFRSHGWQIRDAVPLSVSIFPYRDYIVGSRAELSVAKDQYVRPRSGWFSDRSACYLAAGKPVVTQETGFSKVLPTGEGLFGFATVDDAVAAIAAVESDYERHSRAAREVAAEFFAAEKIAAAMLREAGV